MEKLPGCYSMCMPTGHGVSLKTEIHFFGPRARLLKKQNLEPFIFDGEITELQQVKVGPAPTTARVGPPFILNLASGPFCPPHRSSSLSSPLLRLHPPFSLLPLYSILSSDTANIR